MEGNIFQLLSVLALNHAYFPWARLTSWMYTSTLFVRGFMLLAVNDERKGKKGKKNGNGINKSSVSSDSHSRERTECSYAHTLQNIYCSVPCVLLQPFQNANVKLKPMCYPLNAYINRSSSNWERKEKTRDWHFHQRFHQTWQRVRRGSTATHSRPSYAFLKMGAETLNPTHCLPISPPNNTTYFSSSEETEQCTSNGGNSEITSWVCPSESFCSKELL